LKLKISNISHGDLKGTNILIKNNEAYLIDLDAMTQGKISAEKRIKKDMNRFIKNFNGNKKELEAAKSVIIKKQ